VGQLVNKSPSAPMIPTRAATATAVHPTDHIPVYDSSRGGYITGTGDVMGNTTSGDYNDYGRSGVGVNHTVESQGDMAYGGALGASYGDPYSVVRNGPSSVTSASVASVESISISAISSSSGNEYGVSDISTSGYTDPYSVKRK
jgi:hypothetical protein